MIDQLVGEGARWMLAEALVSEADDYIERLVAERDERGHRWVVRNTRCAPCPASAASTGTR